MFRLNEIYQSGEETSVCGFSVMCYCTRRTTVSCSWPLTSPSWSPRCRPGELLCGKLTGSSRPQAGSCWPAANPTDREQWPSADDGYWNYGEHDRSKASFWSAGRNQIRCFPRKSSSSAIFRETHVTDLFCKCEKKAGVTTAVGSLAGWDYTLRFYLRLQLLLTLPHIFLVLRMHLGQQLKGSIRRLNRPPTIIH